LDVKATSLGAGHQPNPDRRVGEATPSAKGRDQLAGGASTAETLGERPTIIATGPAGWSARPRARRPKEGAMADGYLSEQARHALSTARTLAHERHHTALGPPHLLAAVLRQWDDERAGGPALLRGCGLTVEQATDLITTLEHAYDHPEAATPEAEPRPNPAMRLILAHAHRIATQAHAPCVGTEHLVIAALWLDDAHELRRLGITYQQATERLATLPRTEQAVDGAAIEPLEAVAVPTPAAAALAELARQQAEQHPIDGRVSTLHYLLALLMHGEADKLLGELGVSYNAVRERLAADGTRLVEADDRRPEETPLEGWEHFDVTPQQWEVIHPRVKEVLVDGGLWRQGVRFGFNLNEERTRYRVSIHPGDSGLTHQQVLDRLLGRVA
jgi:Clp amino terminal domain, pathogenicity island component